MCGGGDFSISPGEPKPEIDQEVMDQILDRLGSTKQFKILSISQSIEITNSIKSCWHEAGPLPLKFLQDCLKSIDERTKYPVRVFNNELGKWLKYSDREKDLYLESDKPQNQKPKHVGENGSHVEAYVIRLNRDGYYLASEEYRKKLNDLPKDFRRRIYDAECAKKLNNGEVWVRHAGCDWYIERHAKNLPLPEIQDYEPSKPIEPAAQLASDLDTVEIELKQIPARINQESQEIVKVELEAEQKRIDAECRGDMKQLEKALDSLRLMEQTRRQEIAAKVTEKYRPLREKLEKERDRLKAELLNHAIVKTPQPESYYTEKKEIPASNNSAKIVSELIKNHGQK